MKKQAGKKNRRKIPPVQLGQPGESGKGEAIESFEWESHPNVIQLFISVVKVRMITIIIIDYHHY